MADQKGRTSLPNQHTLRQNPVVTDGFNMNNAMDDPMDLGASTDAPPAYGDLMDKLNLSQAGFSAGAAVTGERDQTLPSQQAGAKGMEQMMAVSTSTSTRQVANSPICWPLLFEASFYTQKGPLRNHCRPRTSRLVLVDSQARRRLRN